MCVLTCCSWCVACWVLFDVCVVSCCCLFLWFVVRRFALCSCLVACCGALLRMGFCRLHGSLFIVRCSLVCVGGLVFVVICQWLLVVVWCVLFVVSGLLFVSCCLLCVSCCLLCVNCCLFWCSLFLVRCSFHLSLLCLVCFVLVDGCC